MLLNENPSQRTRHNNNNNEVVITFNFKYVRWKFKPNERWATIPKREQYKSIEIHVNVAWQSNEFSIIYARYT